MKTNSTKHWIKVAGLSLAIGAFAFTANAQTAAGTDVLKTQGKTNSGTAAPVRVIDNKGTIKYLQVNNGLTQIVNTTNEVTTTTWQLGGTLTDKTYIDVNGNVFGLDKIDLVNITTEKASTDATDKSVHGTGTGWTLLVRDESTGAIKKMKATDMIQSGAQKFTLVAADVTAKKVTLTGIVLPVFSQVWVYRNGAKLNAGTDYTISGADVTLAPGGTAPNDWALYVDDVIEVQYIK